MCFCAEQYLEAVVGELVKVNVKVELIVVSVIVYQRKFFKIYYSYLGSTQSLTTSVFFFFFLPGIK